LSEQHKKKFADNSVRTIELPEKEIETETKGMAKKMGE